MNMELSLVFRTTVPLILLIGMGALSKKIGLLKTGDERVLSAYLYYFALPALFIVDLSSIRLVENVKFVAVGVLPIAIMLTLFILLHLAIKFSKETLYLLILSTAFGSTAFFGIPFTTFAFSREGEVLAILSSSTISAIGVAASITVLELFKMREGTVTKGIKTALKRLSKNPLMLSTLTGLALSITDTSIPEIMAIPIRMLGSTSITMALFMLGLSLYGKKYAELHKALKLSILRILVLPLLAASIASMLDLPKIQVAVLVIMHGVPVAVSMMVLSERYEFHRETISSLILVQSLGAVVYLNLWLFLLGLMT